jgi:hypothetical protein
MGSRCLNSVGLAKFLHPSGRHRRQAPLLSTVRTIDYFLRNCIESSALLTAILPFHYAENLLSNEILKDLYDIMIATNTSVLSPATEIGDLFDFLFDPEEKPLKQNPHGFMMEPVYSAFEESPELVGFLVGVTSFGNLLDRLLPSGVNGIVCVIKDKCGDAITYELNGLKATYLGAGDLHDGNFDKYERSTPMELYETTFEGRCAHDLYIYPSVTFEETYTTRYPAVYTSVVAVAFFVTSMIIFLYDRCVLLTFTFVSFAFASQFIFTHELYSPHFPVKAGHSATR